MTTRGERNNNPGNIRISATKWQGAADEQLDDSFITFKSAQFGIRAMCRILMSYGNRGINTPHGIISTWAPSVENDTAAYVADVCQRTGFLPDGVLDLDSCDTMRPLLKAIVHHENGDDPYSDTIYNDAMRMAGISDAEPKPITKDNTIRASTITTIGGATAAVSEGIRQVSNVNDTVETVRDTAIQSFSLLQWAIHYGPWLAVALIALGIGGIVWSKMQDRNKLGA